MLTADLVTARRRGNELRVVVLSDEERTRAEALAGDYLALARGHVGKSRRELEAAWNAVPTAAREQRLAAAVRKLVGDRCRYAEGAGADSAALRAAVFQAATEARRALPVGGDFDRTAIVAAVAAARQATPEAIESALFADLHGAERLNEVGALDPVALAAGFDQAQAQAVLLRATRVLADVCAGDAGRLRALFAKMKFLRLLHTITPVDSTPGKDRYRIEIDGPFSLFQSVTRYGVQLGLALPAIADCDRWSIDAQVLWGRARLPLRFQWAGENRPDDGGIDRRAPTALPDEVTALMEAVNGLGGPWRALPSTEIVHLPAVGLCVPDLAFENERTGAGALLEVLGFWSREAVWRRIDLVRAGISRPILFAVSKQLRVSEAALDGDLPSALYVYARAMNARAVLERIERIAARSLRPGSARPPD